LKMVPSLMFSSPPPFNSSGRSLGNAGRCRPTGRRESG
jgi:hypothetical protein